MNIIKTIKIAAAGALMYAAAALGIGCSTIPIYDATNDISIVRFENKQNLTDRLNCWHRIDIKSEDNNDFNGFFAKLLPEYDLGKGFGVAAQYLAVQGDDIVRAGIAYGKKIGANKFAKFRILAPLNDASNPEIDIFLVYNGENVQGSALFLYNTDNDTLITELTATFGDRNVKPFVQLVGSGPIDDLEGKLLLGAQFTPKK